MRSFCYLTTLAVLVSSVVGCENSGPRRNPVSGKVSFKDEPVKFGTINFRSAGSEGHVGSAEIKDGHYAMLAEVGLPAGEYQVAITYPDPKTPAPKSGEAPGVSTPVREMLPEKYNNKTELKTTIKDGPNDGVDFDLK